jgi:uncharacterized protein (UPF0548 family)
VLSATRPGEKVIRRLLERGRDADFSYPEVGATRDVRGGEQRRFAGRYALDHHRVQLGRGPELFEAAKAALARWEMFRIDWLDLCWPDAPIEEGSSVAVLARIGGLWSLNPCRVVYPIDDAGEVERFGFAYGTLPGHAVCGEERFTVEHDLVDDAVAYDLLVFSRPAGALEWLGLPVLRRLQGRFARDSLDAMRRAAQTSLRRG